MTLTMTPPTPDDLSQSGGQGDGEWTTMNNAGLTYASDGHIVIVSGQPMNGNNIPSQYRPSTEMTAVGYRNGSVTGGVFTTLTDVTFSPSGRVYFEGQTPTLIPFCYPVGR